MNVIVTGASKGIGKAIATKFAEDGHNLFLCARNAALLETTAEAIRKKNPAIVVKALPVDLSLKAETIKFASWCLQHMVPDILINNAGVYLPGNTMDEPEGHLEKM